MYPYTLLGISLENNIITVQNNHVSGAPMQLDCAFVMRSGRAEKMFSPEDIEIMTQATGLTTEEVIQKPALSEVKTKLRLVA